MLRKRSGATQFMFSPPKWLYVCFGSPLLVTPWPWNKSQWADLQNTRHNTCFLLRFPPTTVSQTWWQERVSCQRGAVITVTRSSQRGRPGGNWEVDNPPWHPPRHPQTVSDCTMLTYWGLNNFSLPLRTESFPFWWGFHYWLYRKLPKW